MTILTNWINEIIGLVFPHVIILAMPFVLVLMIIVSLYPLFTKKKKIGIIIAVAVLVINHLTETFALGSFFEKGQAYFSIMTYNCQSTSSCYMREHRENPTEMYEMIASQNVDVLCLQEYEGWYCDYLKRYLDQDYPYFVQMPDMPKESAVFSKYPIEDVEQIKDKLVMSMTINSNGRKLKLFVCHFSSNRYDRIRKEMGDSLKWYDGIGRYLDGIEEGGSQRVIEAKCVNAKVDSCRTLGLPIIICGDLNDVGGSYPLFVLKNESGLKDVWWEKGFGLGSTYHGHNWMRFRLDHILCSKEMSCTSVKVVNQEFSDHDPLVASFERF